MNLPLDNASTSSVILSREESIDLLANLAVYREFTNRKILGVYRSTTLEEKTVCKQLRKYLTLKMRVAVTLVVSSIATEDIAQDTEEIIQKSIDQFYLMKDEVAPDSKDTVKEKS